MHVAKSMPTIVSSDELDILRLEIRHYKSETKIIVDDTLPVNKYWQGALELIDCPVLTRLVRASLILPHGNAEVERLFSMLGDILVKKRQNLDQRSIRSLTFIKSDMKCRGTCVLFWLPSLHFTPDACKWSKAGIQTKTERRGEEESSRNRTGWEVEAPTCSSDVLEGHQSWWKSTSWSPQSMRKWQPRKRVWNLPEIWKRKERNWKKHWQCKDLNYKRKITCSRSSKGTYVYIDNLCAENTLHTCKCRLHVEFVNCAVYIGTLSRL